MSADSASCSFTFKKVGARRFQARKRRAASGDESSEDETHVVRAARTGVSTSSSGVGVRRGGSSETTEGGDDGSSVNSSVSVCYQSQRTQRIDGPADMGATAIVQVDTDTDRDARAVFERALEVNEQLTTSNNSGENGVDKNDKEVYRGQANYQQFIAKRDTALGNAASGHNRHGPMRAPSNLRTTVRWDYKPDICKDYKETGFCGFGDSCIFMHDRTDYKFGWQLEREMERNTYGAADDQDYRVVDSDEDEEHRLPFRCFICRKSFRSPVVTKCRHYFCEQCALAEYKKSRRCFVCGAQTHGVFNVAKELIERLQQKNGERDESDDED